MFLPVSRESLLSLKCLSLHCPSDPRAPKRRHTERKGRECGSVVDLRCRDVDM